jgi:ER membrane protein complex subunit 1
MQNLPSNLLNFIRRFTTGNYNAINSAGTKNGTVELYRDVFGFQKVILAASASGKVYALDSATGNIIYSRVLSLGGSPGATFRIVKLFTMRSASYSTDLPLEAALVLTRSSQVSHMVLSRAILKFITDGYDDLVIYFRGFNR